MGSRIPVIFLELWYPSETWDFFADLPGVKRIEENDIVIGLMIPSAIMNMQNPIVENFKKKSMDTFTGLYNFVVCWRVSSPEIPF